MGLPAFKERFEALSAETRSRAEAVSREADIVSITMAKLIKSVDKVVESQDELRVLFIMGRRELPTLFEKVFTDQPPANVDAAAEIRPIMRRFIRRISRPYAEDVDGRSVMSAVVHIEGMRTSSSGEARLLRRLAKRVREHADACDVQRANLVATMNDIALRYDEELNSRFDAEEVRAALVRAVATKSMKRFPMVNAYLAR